MQRVFQSFWAYLANEIKQNGERGHFLSLLVPVSALGTSEPFHNGISRSPLQMVPGPKPYLAWSSP